MLDEVNKTGKFVKEVATYFRDFLETDFKKRRIPKRSIKFKNEKNFLIGLTLRKYPEFNKKLWKLINNSFQSDRQFIVKKNEYKATISIALQNLINKQIEFVDENIIDEIINQISFHIIKESKINKNDPEKAYNNVTEQIYHLLQTNIVLPFVDKIRSSIEEASQSDASSVESISDVEERLTEILSEPMYSGITEKINELIIKKDKLINKQTDLQNNETVNTDDENEEKEIIISEFKSILSKKFIQETVKNYFQDFALTDLYFELNTLVDSKHLLDKQEIYLYFGEIKFERNNFPIFYIPIQINKTQEGYLLEFDSVFYINKKALDFINQEYNKTHNTFGTLKSVSERIIYIAEQSEGIMPKINSSIREMSDKFSIPGNLDFTKSNTQKYDGLNISITNNCFLCIFDKSDESIVNDYEDMMQIIDEGDNLLSGSFNKLIEDFIKNEPETITSNVEKEWYDETSYSEKLVFASPIPLNAEQRQILNAIKRKNCKYIVVEGPPGTGKSHTITAITFEAIRNNQSVLILSDKKEALDVAENKITETMDKVRLSKDIQNPILRLGKSGNTYTQILSNASLNNIKEHTRAVENTKDDMEKEIENVQNSLEKSIEESIQKNKNVSMDDIQEMFSHENNINEGWYENIYLEEFNSKNELELLNNFKYSIDYFKNFNEVVFNRTKTQFDSLFPNKTINDYLNFIDLINIAKSITQEYSGYKSLLSLKNLNKDNFENLNSYIHNLQQIKKSAFGLGFFFKKSEVNNVNSKILNDYKIINFNDPHKRITELQTVTRIIDYISDRINYYQLNSSIKNYENDPYSDVLVVLKNIELFNDFNLKDTKIYIELIREFIEKSPLTSEKINLSSKTFDSILNNILVNDNDEKFKSIVNYLNLNYNLREVFGSIPDFDFNGVKSQLEDLVTTKTTQIMDKQVVDFAESNPAAAKTIKTIIKNKERFPKEEFEKLKKAFPCIIAGIRDYADYIPLEADLIDLVIIDEASQVSIAQAFPALLRAKKILVMGDKKQFSNIKSNQAKNETNNEYLSGLKSSFNTNIGSNISEVQRLGKFDIKTSILDFFEYIHNFRIMLKKHFRGYPELISYSSKYFYDNSLQSVKIRAKPIDEVLKFKFIEHDDKISLNELENSNKLESDFIIEQLKEMKENNETQSVGIITPFTNQQKFISSEISKLPEADYFYETLKLKVMTFDGCQGEERDTIFYSMVVNPLKDNLNSIFIKSLENRDLEEDASIRVARLNVGFSRAKECMHFVLSKPITEYNDEIGNALKHFFYRYEEIKKGADVGSTDANSPMESKVLKWIRETNFYQNNVQKIELKAQFKAGEYLKQIDKYYTHPKYKTDFLLTYKADNKKYIQIIIEYDGFEHHFKNKENVNELNYQHYYKDDDIYREKVLEGYGYTFLRINRFNLGTNPVETLDSRFNKIIEKKSPQII